MDNQYNEFQFHDNRIWAIRFDMNAENSDLAFDIDHILSWGRDQNTGALHWLISPATLRFKGVTGLQMRIDWQDIHYQSVKEVCINHIKREEIKEQRVYLDRDYFKFTMFLGDDNSISFGSFGYDLTVRKEPVVSMKQHLDAELRIP